MEGAGCGVGRRTMVRFFDSASIETSFSFRLLAASTSCAVWSKVNREHPGIVIIREFQKQTHLLHLIQSVYIVVLQR